MNIHTMHSSLEQFPHVNGFVHEARFWLFIYFNKPNSSATEKLGKQKQQIQKNKSVD